MRLTDLTIKSLTPPEKGERIYYDDLITGFGVRVSEGGTKSFVLTHGVRRQRQTIGRVGIIGLADARSAAKKKLAEYTLGKHQAIAMTWDAALAEYLVDLKKRRRASTYGHYKRFLSNYFRFGESKLSALTTTDFTKKLDKLAGRPGEHQTAFVIVNVFLNWCVRREYLDRNPLTPVSAPHKYKRRKRVLDDAALREVWDAAGELGTYGQLVRLLIVFGQRRGEAGALTRKMDGGDRITLPDWLTKNHKEHTFPIGPMARAILDKRPGQLYFPAAGTTDTLMSGWSKMKKRLDKLSGVSGWTLHDLRRTFRTNCAKLGVPADIAKRYINHARAKNDMDETYDQYSYFPEMQDLVKRWEKYLHGVIES